MADWLHVITHGQSLSIGGQGALRYTSISTASEAPNVFSAKLDGTLIPHQLNTTEFPDLQRPDLSMGYRTAQAFPNQTFVFTTHGQGAKRIDQLSKGGDTGRYEALIDRVTKVKANAVAQGKTYRVYAVVWEQGEADQGQGTPDDEYLMSLDQLVSDLNSDIKPITGQTEDIPLIMGQTASWPEVGGVARIGLVQLEAARSRALMHIAGGQYQFPYVDEVHPLNATEYYHLGELLSKSLIKMLSGGVWEALSPSVGGMVLTNTSLTIPMHVPSPPLAFDTNTVPAQPNYGFSLSGTDATISSVSISGNSVVLGLSAPITESGARVGYAVSNASRYGNLRDSASAFSPLDYREMRNWCVQFSDPLSISGGLAPLATVQRVTKIVRVDNGNTIQYYLP